MQQLPPFWPTKLGVVAFVCTELKVWPVSNFVQQLLTTSNNMQQGVQTDAVCNIQQRCVRLQGALSRAFNHILSVWNLRL